MSIEMKLDAEVRADLGRGASRRLRQSGKIPAVLYGGHKDAVSLVLLANQVMRLQQEEAFYSQILTVVINGKQEQAVLKDMQRHPFKPVILHVDLQRVVAGEKMRASVPVHVVGGDEAVKAQGGVIIHDMPEVEIECLPKDLPQSIEVNVADLKLGEIVHLSKLQLPKGVTIPALAQGPDHDAAVVTLMGTRADAAASEGEASE